MELHGSDEMVKVSVAFGFFEANAIITLETRFKVSILLRGLLTRLYDFAQRGIPSAKVEQEMQEFLSQSATAYCVQSHREARKKRDNNGKGAIRSFLTNLLGW